MLSSRELASLIWLGVLAVAVIVMAIRDRSIARNFADILRQAVRHPISTFILGFFAYMAAWVGLAARLGAWKEGMLKETLIWGFVSGLAIAFSATEADDDPAFFKKAIRRTVGLTVFLEFFFGLASFPFVVEVIVQPVLALLVMMEIVAKGEEKFAPAASCLGFMLGFAGLTFIIATMAVVWQTRGDIDWDQQALVFGMLIWLPIVALPFVYVLSWVMNYGTILRFIRLSNDDGPIPLSIRLAVIAGFNVNLHHLGRAARIHPANELARARSFREAYQVVLRFRRHLGEDGKP